MVATQTAPVVLDGHAKQSFAQEGEDMVLQRFFEGRKTGVYVDVGAHHPRRFSNTAFFYRRGWRGINIDAMPGSMQLFRDERPEDVNLELAIGRGAKETYFVFNEPALNGLSRSIAERRDGRAGNRIVNRIEVRTATLAQVLDEHLPAGMAIDFLTIDVEGHDLEVLESNDWSRYRPRLVLVEDLERRPLDEIGSSPVVSFLRNHGYRAWAKTFNTIILEVR
jgi:FkbM family methyltransferase